MSTAPAVTMQGFRQRVVNSSIWNIVAAFVRYGFDITVNVILARLLVPADFGLLAMAMVGSRFVAIFGSLGLGRALVQREEVDQTYCSTVFWLSLALNVVIGVVVAATAPLLALFYEEPRLVAITLVVALQFPISGLSTVPRALLERDLAFTKLAKIQLWVSAATGAFSIALAALGAGVWSIVIRSVLVVAATSVILFFLTSWRPRLLLSWERARGMMSFSGPYYGDQLLKFASRNLDTVLIGRFLGSAPLGLYSRAYTLMTLPIMMTSRSLVQVLFAAFSSIQSETERVKKLFLRYNGALFFFLCPVMFGAAGVAEPGVLALLGEDWVEMVPVVQILAPSGVWQGITGLISALYMAKGQTALQLRYSLIGRGLVLGGITGGLYWGIEGVAMGFAVGSFLDTWVNLHVAGKLVDLRVREMVGHLLGVFVASSVMLGLVLWLDSLAAVNELNVWVRLSLLVGAGVAVFAVLILVLRPAPYRDIRELGGNYLASRRKKAEKAKRKSEAPKVEDSDQA